MSAALPGVTGWWSPPRPGPRGHRHATTDPLPRQPDRATRDHSPLAHRLGTLAGARRQAPTRGPRPPDCRAGRPAGSDRFGTVLRRAGQSPLSPRAVAAAGPLREPPRPPQPGPMAPRLPRRRRREVVALWPEAL